VGRGVRILGKTQNVWGKRGNEGWGHENFCVFLGRGRGRERGQHYTPKYVIFFYMTLGS